MQQRVATVPLLASGNAAQVRWDTPIDVESSVADSEQAARLAAEEAERDRVALRIHVAEEGLRQRQEIIKMKLELGQKEVDMS